MPDDTTLTRRGFAKTALAAAAVAPLAACAAAPEPAPPAPAPAAPSPRADAEPKQPDPEVEAQLALIRARWGSRLDEAQLAKVREALEGNARVARTLREFKLPIETEPASVYRVYFGGGGI